MQPALFLNIQLQIPRTSLFFKNYSDEVVFRLFDTTMISKNFQLVAQLVKFCPKKSVAKHFDLKNLLQNL